MNYYISSFIFDLRHYLDLILFFFASSHYIEVPAGPHLLSDVLLSSALVAGEAGVGAAMQGMGGAGGGGFEFGFDPNADPELALAMRLSLEESQRNNAPQGGEQPAADAKPAETHPKRKYLRVPTRCTV
jgi:hypothetical protein